MTTIRASSLPQYSDCPRRHAARSFTDVIEEQGFTLRHTPQSIGAAIGTGTHEALGFILTERMEGREVPESDWKEKATQSIDENTAEGVVWDATTTNIDAAYNQAIRMTKATVQTVLDDIKPIAVECAFKADLGDGFILSGHLDILEKIGVGDFKTGTVQRANQAQYGGYSLLAKSNGHNVERLREIYIRRVGPTKPQPDPVVVDYNLAVAERAAREAIRHIKRGMIEFQKDSDPWVFLPNPNSMMCSADYCPAHGTKFCRAHKGEIK